MQEPRDVERINVCRNIVALVAPCQEEVDGRSLGQHSRAETSLGELGKQIFAR
jgi:hypothetical protein